VIVDSASDTLLWMIDAGAYQPGMLAPYHAWLGQEEQARCERFVRSERQRQFIVGRALLRSMLGRLLDIAPQAVTLIEQPGKAPALDRAMTTPIGLSISHSGPWVACAVSAKTAVGLDIERIDPARDVLALAEQAFGTDDVAILRACEPAMQHAAFYRMWCAHEACIKLGRRAGAVAYPAAGKGLAAALACAEALPLPPIMQLVRLPDL